MADKIHISVIESNNLHINMGEGTISPGGVAVQGTGTYVHSVGTVQFQTGNNFSFGLATNGVMTASYAQSTHDHPYAGATHSHGSIYTEGIAGSVMTNSSASSGLTLGMPAWITAAGASAGIAGVIISDSTYTSGSVSFKNANAISFGSSGEGIVTASFSQSTHAHDYIATADSSLFQHTTATSAVTSAAFPSADTTKFAGPGFTTTATAGTEVVGTLNSLGLKIGVPAFLTTAGAGGGAALQGSGTYTQNSGTIQFANSNDITFGLTSNQMTASFSQSTHAHDYVETANSSLLQHTSATSAVTSAAFPSADTTKFAGVGETTGSISGTDLKITVNTDGVSLEVPKWITTYAAGGGSIAFSAGASTADLASIVFSNSNNVSFGLNGSTVTASASYSNPGATVFSNSNNVSFGLNGSTVTASATFAQSAEPRVVSFNGTSGSLTFNAGTYLSLSQNGVSFTLNVTDTSAITTNAFPSANTTKFAGTGTTIGATAGTLLKITLDSNGLNASVPAWITTYAAQTAEPRVVSLNGSSGSMSLATGSSLSSSTDGSTITFGLASNITTALQSANANYLTSQSVQAASGSNGSFTFQTLSFGSANVTFYTNASGMQGSYSQSTHPHDYLATDEPHIREINVTNGSYSNNTLNLRASTNITLSADGASIKFSVADAIPLANSTAYQTSVLSNTFQLTSNTSAITSNAFPSANTTKFAGTGTTIDATAGTLLKITLDSNGLNASVPAWITTYAAQTYQPVAFSGSNTSTTASTISFGNSNSFDFYITNGSLVGKFTESTHAHPYMASESTSVFQYTSNTSAITSNAFPSADTTKFAGTGTTAVNATFTLNSNGLNLSVAAPDAAAEANWINLQGNTASNTTASGSTIMWSAGNNITLAATNGSIVQIIGAAGGSVDWSVATTNAGTDIIISTGAATNTLYHPAYLTAGGGNGTSIVPGDYLSSTLDGSTLSLSVTGLQATSATSAITADAMNTSERGNYIYASAGTNATNISYTLGSNSLSFSVGDYITTAAAVSHSHGDGSLALTNLTGTTNSASNGWTISLNAFPAGTLSLINTNGVSFVSSSDGSTTSVSASVETAYIPLANSTKFGSMFSLSNFVHPEYGFVDLGAIGQGSLSIKRVFVPFNVTGTAFKIAVSLSGSTNTSATTASANLSFRYGIYSLNGSTLSLSTSGSAANSFVWSQNDSSTGNTSIDGMRQVTGSMNVSLVPGYYWVAAVISSSTTYTNCGVTIYGGPGFELNSYGNAIAPIGSGTTASSFVIPFQGIYTAATASCPNSIGKAAIDWTSASNVARANFYNAIYASTY